MVDEIEFDIMDADHESRINDQDEDRFESEVSAEQEIMEVNSQFERWKQAMFREEEALAWITEVARANLEYQKGNEI